MSILKNKPRYSVDVGNGAFIADFYVDEKRADVEHNYLHIHTPNHVFEQKCAQCANYAARVWMKHLFPDLTKEVQEPKTNHRSHENSWCENEL